MLFMRWVSSILSRALNVALRIVTKMGSSPSSLKTAKCRRRLFVGVYAGTAIICPADLPARQMICLFSCPVIVSRALYFKENK